MAETETTRKRDSMPFPFRWKNTLLELEDCELRRMLEAIFDYGETGTKPDFKGAMAGLWHEISARIDHDRDKYSEICTLRSELGKKGAMARWQKMANAILPIANDGKNAEGEGEGDNNNKETVTIVPVSSPEPEKSGKSGKCNPDKIFFDYEGDLKLHGITQQQLDLWKENFPALDVETELKSASAWLDGNRKNRKTDVKRFLVNWLKRAQDHAPRRIGTMEQVQTGPRWAENEKGENVDVGSIF